MQSSWTREKDASSPAQTSTTASDFADAAIALSAGTRHGLARARVAHKLVYDVEANWKLVWENNRECLHCSANHPQYVVANFDRFVTGHEQEDHTARLAEPLTEAGDAGSTEVLGQDGLATYPSQDDEQWWSANHTVLQQEFGTESIDGQLVSLPLAHPDDRTELTLRLRTLPNFWSHVSVDYAMTTALWPTGPTSTRVVVSWLVAAEARGGLDYQLSRLLPFWRTTSEQDWEICERQQQGVSSLGYRPGPLSDEAEQNVEAFLAWYARRMAA